MAYQYKAAFVRSKAIDATWGQADLSAVTLRTIYQSYSKVYLTLTHPALSGDAYLDLALVRDSLGTLQMDMTVTQWLVSLGNKALPTVTNRPDIIERAALYGDAWAAGYRIQPFDRKRSPDAEIPFQDKNDLLLRKSGVNFQSLWPYCMVSVNGYFHRIGGSTAGLVVMDGGRTGRIGNDNHVGVLSFREVGKLDYISINSSMLYKVHPDQKFANHVHVKLPYDIDGKTVFMVIGGYLHAMDGCYEIIGPRSLRIDFNNYQLAARIYQSRKTLNLETLGLTVREKNPDQIALDELYSDETIRAYLTLPQSFIVVLDTPNVYVRKHYPEKTKLPGRFATHPSMGRLPLFSSYGRLFEYQATNQDTVCMLSCDNAIDHRYNFASTHYRSGTSIDNVRESSDPWDYARAYQLEIGRYN